LTAHCDSRSRRSRSWILIGRWRGQKNTYYLLTPRRLICVMWTRAVIEQSPLAHVFSTVGQTSASGGLFLQHPETGYSSPALTRIEPNRTRRSWIRKYTTRNSENAGLCPSD